MKRKYRRLSLNERVVIETLFQELLADSFPYSARSLRATPGILSRKKNLLTNNLRFAYISAVYRLYEDLEIQSDILEKEFSIVRDFLIYIGVYSLVDELLLSGNTNTHVIKELQRKAFSVENLDLGETFMLAYPAARNALADLFEALIGGMFLDALVDSNTTLAIKAVSSVARRLNVFESPSAMETITSTSIAPAPIPITRPVTATTTPVTAPSNLSPTPSTSSATHFPLTTPAPPTDTPSTITSTAVSHTPSPTPPSTDENSTTTTT